MSIILSGMNVGEIIKRAREEAGLTQPELWELIRDGYKQSAISHWETGRRNPNFDDVAKIAEVLGLSVVEMIQKYSEQVPIRKKDKKVIAAEKAFSKKYMSLPAANRAKFVERLLKLPEK